MNCEKRIVITGMGVLCPIGNDLGSFWHSLSNGISGIDTITHFDPVNHDTKIAGQIKNFQPELYLSKKEANKLVRFIQLSVAATKMALADSNLIINETNAPEIGVLIGSGIGGLSYLEEQAKVLLEKGPSRINPFTVPYMIADMAAGYSSIAVGAKGPNSCVVTACASGTNSIGDAYKLIQRGAAKAMLAGGAEAAITPLGLASFSAAQALSNENDAPQKASKPFDKNRSGFVMGEGSGVIVLEDLEYAKARNARIYAEIVGYGMSGDANHITAPAPGGEGAVRAIRAALLDAKLKPTDIDYINAHGTSTPINDRNETQAIKKVFGAHAYEMKVSSNKSMLGHLLGASGGIEFIATALTIMNDIVPPTMNIQKVDEDMDLDYVPNKAAKMVVRAALTNSFGFGGHNATLALKKYNG